jgi:O-antigen/teichoic acid export membrane protein
MRAYLLSLLATAFPNALGFVAFPLYAKALGATDYGCVALLEAYQGFLSMLLFLGMTNAFFVFYSHAKEEREKQQILATSAAFALIILVLVALIAFLSPALGTLLFKNETASPYIAIYAFAIFSDYLLTLANTYLRVEEKIGSLACNAIAISLIHHGLSFLLVVICGGGIACFITIFLTTKAAACGIALYHLCRGRVPFNLKFVCLPLFHKMIRFGAPLVLTALTGWVLLLSDRLFINYYVSTADVGVYAVGYKFAMGLWIGIVQPFMVVWEPSLIKAFRSAPEEGYARLKRDFSLYLAAIVILYSAFILFIGPILELLFAGTDYAGEAPLIYLLAGSYFLMAVGEMCAALCRLHKSSQFAVWTTLAAMTTKIAFNSALIPSYLLLGAAAASLLAELIAQTILLTFAMRLAAPANPFISRGNAVLLSLFVLCELSLYLIPQASMGWRCATWMALLLATYSAVQGQVGGTINLPTKDKSRLAGSPSNSR